MFLTIYEENLIVLIEKTLAAKFLAEYTEEPRYNDSICPAPSLPPSPPPPPPKILPFKNNLPL